MPSTKTQEPERKESGVAGYFGTAEWLIVAFASTLVFIVFEMQAYTIPTGSMADTLKGAHFRLRCAQCGYRYDYDFIPKYYGLDRNTTPGNNVPVLPPASRCPSCGFRRQSAQKMPVIKGDRIFVLKCLYQFIEPKRWDVVVFKNPLEPHENYIKRMIALPGEKVEIVDGDIYIDDRIARKPGNVQEELWTCIYANDYQPVNPSAGNFNGGVWRQPFVNFRGSGWKLKGDGPTVFSLDESGGEVHEIVYDTSTGNDFRASYAYDDPRGHEFTPICSDLLTSFDVDRLGEGSRAGASMSKYGVEYKGWVDSSGKMSIEKVHANGLVEELAAGKFTVTEQVCGTFRFANVDHMAVLEFAGEKIEHDMGAERDSMGAITQEMPRVAILGAGGVRLMHLGLYRDIHYIGIRADGGEQVLRAAEGDPFVLGEDEFFVLGDNSPASLDCRWWDSPGLANNGRSYREGTVPRDYLVGKAFFVYWPGPFKPFNDSAIGRMLENNRAGKIFKMLLNVPYVDGMKIIRGGR